MEATQKFDMLEYVCWCLRKSWKNLPSESRKAVEVVERFIDGKASKVEMQTAHQLAREAINQIPINQRYTDIRIRFIPWWATADHVIEDPASMEGCRNCDRWVSVSEHDKERYWKNKKQLTKQQFTWWYYQD